MACIPKFNRFEGVPSKSELCRSGKCYWGDKVTKSYHLVRQRCDICNVSPSPVSEAMPRLEHGTHEAMLTTIDPTRPPKRHQRPMTGGQLKRRAGWAGCSSSAHHGKLETRKLSCRPGLEPCRPQLRHRHAVGDARTVDGVTGVGRHSNPVLKGGTLGTIFVSL